MVSLNKGCIIGNEPCGLHGDFGGNNANMCVSALFFFQLCILLMEVKKQLVVLLNMNIVIICMM